MSTTKETAQFDLVVNGANAQKALDDTRARAITLGGGLDAVVGGLDKIGGKSGADAEKAARALSFALGSAGGAGSEFLGVIGDISGVLSGGALALALTGVGIAGAKIAESLQEAEQGARGFDAAVLAMNETVRKATEDRIAKMTSGLQDLRTELANFGKDARQLALDDIQAGIETDEKNRPGLAAKAAAQRADAEYATMRATVLRGSGAQDAAEQANELASATETKLNALDARLATSKVTLEEQTRLVGELDARDANKTNEAAATAAAKAFSEAEQVRRARAALDAADAERKATYDATIAKIAVEKKLEDEWAVTQDSLAKDDIERARTVAETIRDIKAEVRRQDVENAKLVAAEEKAVRDKQVAETQSYALTTIGIGVSASQSFIDALITGQDHATEHFIANVARQTGSALIGYGTQSIAAGIASAANPFTAAAAPGEFAAGAALIAGGIALGAVGTGIETAIGGGGSGTSTAGARSAAATDPGIPSAGGTTAASGPAVININFEYGVGPTPEKMARDVAQAIGVARSRRILVDPVRR